MSRAESDRCHVRRLRCRRPPRLAAALKPRRGPERGPGSPTSEVRLSKMTAPIEIRPQKAGTPYAAFSHRIGEVQPCSSRSLVMSLSSATVTLSRLAVQTPMSRAGRSVIAVPQRVRGPHPGPQWYYRPDYLQIMRDCANTAIGVWSETRPIAPSWWPSTVPLPSAPPAAALSASDPEFKS
jgi:hypothetical protein